jgi:hypothetical protein
MDPYDELREGVRLMLGDEWADNVWPVSWEELPEAAARRVTRMFPNTVREVLLGSAPQLIRREGATGVTGAGLRQLGWTGRIPVVLDRGFLNRAILGRPVDMPLEHVLAHEMAHAWWEYAPQRLLARRGTSDIARQLVRAIMLDVFPEVGWPRGPITEYWFENAANWPWEIGRYVQRYHHPEAWSTRVVRPPAEGWKRAWLNLAQAPSLGEPVAEMAGAYATNVRPTNRAWTRIVKAFTDIDPRLAPVLLGGVGAALLARQLLGHRREA